MRKLRHSAAIWTVAVFWGAQGVELVAQSPQTQSIDLLVAAADRVVIGRVVATKGSSDAIGSRREGDTTVVNVVRTIKGPDDRRLSVPASDWDGLSNSEAYPRDSDQSFGGHRLLIALGHEKPPRITVIDLDSPSLHVMGADLLVLKNADDVIKAAEGEVYRITIEGPVTDGFDWPAPGFDKKDDPFAGQQIGLPVDKRLEERAHRILKDHPEGSPLAIVALGFFKSEENIQLLRSLLARTHDESIRRYAASVLQRWGVATVTLPGNHPSMSSISPHRQA